MTTQIFTYTGSLQMWNVPIGVTQITMTAKGASGGDNPLGAGGVGGLGAEVTAVIPVTSDEPLFIYVGGRGTDGLARAVGGGGNGFFGGGRAFNDWYTAGGGGGASSVRNISGDFLTEMLILAAGGGGAGGGPSTAGSGGDGGGLTGDPGTGPHPGLGGTQSAGGAAGGVDMPNDDAVAGMTAGALGLGGNGTSEGVRPMSGAGGEGWYGGGGGGGASAGASGSSGGGGGSSYIPSGGTATAGVNSGDGLITFEWVAAWSVGFVGWTG